MPNIIPIPALNDNYIWMITHLGCKETLVIDPGDAAPVIETIEKQELTLAAILFTHHHWDHTNGIEGLLQKYNVPVYGPAKSKNPLCDHPVNQDDYVHLPQLDIYLRVLEIPGHTLDHIAYVGLHGVFCGDTLFTAGCGRLFEGTANQMWRSLNLLANLSPETSIYCGHEYTELNLRFAELVEPENTHIKERLHHTQKMRDKGLPTVPALLETELQTNPFLRCHLPSIKNSVEQHCERSLTDPIEVFSELRKWKDGFR